MPLERPIKASGHLQILYGNIAPEGCVGKITGKEGLEFEGRARVFDSEEDMLHTLEKDPQSFKVHCLGVNACARQTSATWPMRAMWVSSPVRGPGA